MDADWMYSSYHFSHPILPERLGALGWVASEKKADGKEADSEKPIKASDREL
jgi:STE24 endopeptidase